MFNIINRTISEHNDMEHNSHKISPRQMMPWGTSMDIPKIQPLSQRSMAYSPRKGSPTPKRLGKPGNFMSVGFLDWILDD